MVDLAYLKSNVFPGESGGDYNALFGYANRGSGPFGGIKLTDMTINQVLDFTDPRGPYAQSVKGQIGRVATPTGAYQVVGRTLRDAVRGLGLTGNEVYDEGTQDRIGQWIYENQGPNAWEAWGKGGNGDRLAGGGGDVSLLGGTQDFSGDANMEPERKGLFGFLGDEEKRARLALALSGLSMYPNEGIMQLARDTIMQAQQRRADRAAQSQAQAAENRTLRYIANLGTPQAQQALQYAQGTGDVAGALKMAMQTADPMDAIQLEKAQIELDRLKNPPAQPAMTDEMFGNLNTLRDDVRTDLATFEVVKQGYNNITTFYSNPSGTSDYALAVAFAKILDPTSVAREGEVTAVQNAGARIPALGQALKNAVTGEGALTPEVRQQIADLATAIYSERAAEAQKKLETYGSLADQVGIPRQFLYGGDIPAARPVIPAVVPPSAAERGVLQEDWDAMTQDERRAFMEVN
jgi:hypothetical protein